RHRAKRAGQALHALRCCGAQRRIRTRSCHCARVGTRPWRRHRPGYNRRRRHGAAHRNSRQRVDLMAWDPSVYMRYADERTRPAVELLARVRCDSPQRVIDLGCGPGNSTAVLAARWPQAKLDGLDSSPDMLAQARHSEVRAEWIEADL